MKCICKEKGTIQEKPCRECDHPDRPIYEHEGNSVTALVFVGMFLVIAVTAVFAINYLAMHFGIHVFK